MKTKVSRKPLQKKYFFLLIIAALVLFIIGLILYRQYAHSNDTAPSSLQQKITDGTPQNSTKATETQQHAANQTTEKGTTSNSYSTPTSSDSIVLDVSQNNPNVVITTKLYGYSDGTCTLNISNGSKSATQDAPVMFQAEYSTCAGFSVPVDQLGSGAWTVKLSVTSGGKTLTKEVSYEVK
jgi:cytoskeletal protein RodZ